MFSGQLMYEKFALYEPGSENFHWYQIVTHMFMHGGLLHLFFNMFVLWQFGKGMEKMWGNKKFLIFYMLSGLGSVALVTLMGGGFPAVGASGAVFGVVVGYVAMYPNQPMKIIFLPWSFKASKFIMFALGLELLLALSGWKTGIGHWAHIGGALTGFLLFVFVLKGRKIKKFDRFIPKSEDYIEAKSVAHRILGYERDIAFDKKSYVRTFFQRVILIDAYIYTYSGNLVWQGDLDMKESEDNLKKLATELKTTIYVTKDNLYKKEYIFKINGKSSSVQDKFLNKYRNKV